MIYRRRDMIYIGIPLHQVHRGVKKGPASLRILTLGKQGTAFNDTAPFTDFTGICFTKQYRIA